MRQVKEVIVGEHTYSITQFSATKGLKLLTRLTKIIGEPIAVLAGEGGLDAEVSGKLMGQAIKALADKLDEANVIQTVKELLEGVTRNGAPINFDIDFAADFKS